MPVKLDKCEHLLSLSLAVFHFARATPGPKLNNRHSGEQWVVRIGWEQDLFARMVGSHSSCSSAFWPPKLLKSQVGNPLRHNTDLIPFLQSHGKCPFLRQSHAFLALILASCQKPTLKHLVMLQTRCPVVPDDCTEIQFAVAGTACQAFSPFGLRKQCQDSRHLPWIVWTEEHVARHTHIVGFENSAHFPLNLHLEKFAATHGTVALKLGPEDLGWPVCRRRLYVCSWSLQKMVWVGPTPPDQIMQDFTDLFCRKLVLDGDVFLSDSQQAHQKRLQELAATQCLHVQPDGDMHGTLNPRDVLSPSSQRHFDMYLDLYKRHCDMVAQDPHQLQGFIADLQQNPQQRSVARSLLPALTTSVLRYSFSAGQYFTDKELYQAHGWPALDESMPFSLESLTSGARQKLLGNGMHLHVVGAFFAYVLSHLATRESACIEVVTISSSEDDAEEGTLASIADQRRCKYRKLAPA